MIRLCCKDCYEKKYGKLPFTYTESETEGDCVCCGERKKMIDDGRPDKAQNFVIF